MPTAIFDTMACLVGTWRTCIEAAMSTDPVGSCGHGLESELQNCNSEEKLAKIALAIMTQAF